MHKSNIKTLFIIILIIILSYAFLSFCNWSISFQEWNGFSRFIVGAEGIIFLLKLIESIWD